MPDRLYLEKNAPCHSVNTPVLDARNPICRTVPPHLRPYHVKSCHCSRRLWLCCERFSVQRNRSRTRLYAAKTRQISRQQLAKCLNAQGQLAKRPCCLLSASEKYPLMVSIPPHSSLIMRVRPTKDRIRSPTSARSANASFSCGADPLAEDAIDDSELPRTTEAEKRNNCQ